MRVYGERIGVPGPIYRLLGQGFSNREIAGKLNLTEITVQECISWMLCSLRMPDRVELVREAFNVEHPFDRHK
jgi:DNA-binding NarL/FixJ family response regulator